jgi:hypothetical protein
VAVANFQRKQPGVVIPIVLDMQTLSPLIFPEDVLAKIIFEKCSLGGEALATVVWLSGAVDDLKYSINYRNKLISELQPKFATMNDLQRIQIYVGAPVQGQVDGRLRQNVEALERQTDDCIFFSMHLAKELMRYGNRLRRRNWMYKHGVKKFLPADWSIAEAQSLLPNEADYADWLSGFVPRPTWWRRLWQLLFGSRAN